MRHYPPSSGKREIGKTKRDVAPDRPGRLVQHARRALAEHRPQKALDLTDKALERMPRLTEIFLVRAGALLDMGHGRLALAYLNAGLDIHPENVDLLVERARVYLELRHFELASGDLQMLARQYPQDAEITHLMAILEEFSGNQDEANSLYRLASKMDPLGFPEPIRLQEATLRNLAAESLETILDGMSGPPPSVHVELMSLPPDELDQDESPGMSPATLGVCMRSISPPGSTQELAQDISSAPLSILLFQRNLERACRNEDDLKTLIGSTIRDELTHALSVDQRPPLVHPAPTL
jgi:tetratricopeptide (TPR) repeat protein